MIITLQNNIYVAMNSQLNQITIQMQIQNISQSMMDNIRGELRDCQVYYHKVLDKNINLDDPGLYQVLQNIYNLTTLKDNNLKFLYVHYPQYSINLVKIIQHVDLQYFNIILGIINDVIITGSQYTVYFTSQQFITCLLQAYKNVDKLQLDIIKILSNLIHDHFQQLSLLFSMLFQFLQQIEFDRIESDLYKELIHFVYLLSREYNDIELQYQILLSQLAVQMLFNRLQVDQRQTQEYIPDYAMIFYNIKLLQHNKIREIIEYMFNNISDLNVIKYTLFLMEHSDKLFQQLIIENMDFQALLKSQISQFINFKIKFLQIMLQNQYDDNDKGILVTLKSVLIMCIQKIQEFQPQQKNMLEKILSITSCFIEVIADQNDVKNILSYIEIQYKNMKSPELSSIMMNFFNQMQRYYINQ